jgi:outer membrane biosynthesis protein TonB
VVVETTIGPDGVPTDAEAKDGPPQLRAFAVEWVKSWRFEPHVVNGQARFTRFKLSLTFTLN